MKKLTKSQAKVFDFLKESIADGITPSVREICLATGLSSTSTVHSHLKSLEELGYITRTTGLNRSIRIVGEEKASQVPILGKITAGIPILAFEDISGYVPFPESKRKGRELFALNVVGESMRDIGILDGDIVICEKTPVAENGEIVVAMIDDEATVKSFYKENNYIRLQPHNPDFEPIITNNVTILGKVIALSRDYDA
ncbi:MAG: transcriptional repressor LexA [Candidatus Pseudoruminococcus sp.]|nr:transcriptional repressor LexA [Ruminococcus sp.]MDY2783724.1 transcriptional repressor LexA [Candidatus Pseudoruminococcus sp.]